MSFHLAEFNIATLKHPLDAAESAEFTAALEPINAIAEASVGFIWRLKGEAGESSSYVSLAEIDDPLEIVNYSIWADLESLKHFVHKSGHSSYLRRRREWFEPSESPATVCWFIPSGSIPDVSEGYRRLKGLREHGPSEAGWPLNKPMEPPKA